MICAFPLERYGHLLERYGYLFVEASKLQSPGEKLRAKASTGPLLARSFADYASLYPATVETGLNLARTGSLCTGSYTPMPKTSSPRAR
jgi:hypothetical protein